MDLADPVDKIAGVGAVYKALLNSGSVNTVKDLLLLIPYKYETLSPKKVSELIPNEKAKIRGRLTKIQKLFTKSRYKIVKGTFEDDTGKISLVWFNQPYIINSIPADTEIYISGKWDDTKSKKPEFVNPEWSRVDEFASGEESAIQPAYSQMGQVSSKWLRKKINDVLKVVDIQEHLDEEFISSNNLYNLKETFFKVHNPLTFEDAKEARKRLGFEELFMLHLRGIKTRRDWGSKDKGFAMIDKPELILQFIESLPFKLTEGQQSAIKDIITDLNSNKPMNRLLQGDVGSGKTIVAASAMYAAYHSGYSSIYLAPTQILANQHFNNLKKFFEKDGIHIELVTGDTGKSNIGDASPNEGKPAIVIGTHAILHRLDQFKKIGLIVIDEQHKFGVSQRSKIIEYYTEMTEKPAKKSLELVGTNKIIPNLLTMTATPIPRSLALAFYGELDLSLINETPVGRKPIITWLVDESKRKGAYDWIKKQIAESGTQVYIVCPFIEESTHEEFQNIKAAEVEFVNVSKYFNDLKVGLLHGRMSAAEKDKVIEDFLAKKTDILVTTTVIEVGVDIPNSNIMIIESPERMGLASLHQLRGRVGRSSSQGYCILISGSPENAARLKYMETLSNGNQLAEIDMKLRGPGNIYGVEQHGFMNLNVADITDIELIKSTKVAAEQVFANSQKYPKIAGIIKNLKYIGDD